LIVRIIAPLHGDTDFDLRQRQIHKPSAPVKQQLHGIGCELHSGIERDVSCVDCAVAVEVHLHSIPRLVQHLNTGHIRGGHRVSPHGVDARLLDVAREQTRRVGQANALLRLGDAQDRQAGNDAHDCERDEQLHHRETRLPSCFRAAISSRVGRHHSSGGTQESNRTSRGPLSNDHADR
jgi:hypothetical protein